MALLRAFSSLGCPQFSLEQTLAQANRRGIGAVELRTLGGSVDLPGYFAATYGTPAALAEQMAGSPVRIVALGTSLKLVGPSDQERADFLRFLPWAEALGVRRLRVFDGGKKPGPAEIEQAAATLDWWRRLRAEHAWKADIAIETHDSLLTSARILALVKAQPGVKILWDSHHTWKIGGEDPVATWRACRDAIVHVHVKDSVPTTDPKAPYSYVLPGAGNFPARALFDALRADGFTGPVSLEWERMWHPELPPLDDALAAAANWGW